MGDPYSCGPQISAAAWSALRAEPDCAFYLIGAPHLVTGVPLREIDAPSEAPAIFAEALPVLALEGIPAVAPGHPDAAAAPGIIQSIERAVADAIAGHASGVVTNPIHKALLYSTGFRFPGHTEFVAHLCEEAGHKAEPVMMLTGGGLRVALATIHMPYADVPRALADGRLDRIARVVHASPAPRLRHRKPASLSPGSRTPLKTHHRAEEVDHQPAADRLRAEVSPYPTPAPATRCSRNLGGAFDAVIAMTHDQVSSR